MPAPSRLSAFCLALVLGATALSAKDIENNKGAGTARPAAPVAPITPVLDESTAAGAVAQQFYNDYVVRYLRGKGKKPKLAAWIAARPDVSVQFKRVFAQADARERRSEMGGWDHDPIINAQDYPDDANMVVKNVSVTGNRAVVTMNWERGMDLAVPVTLLRFPEGWRIHGIGGLVAK